MYSYATGKKCLSNEYVGEMFFFFCREKQMPCFSLSTVPQAGRITNKKIKLKIS